MPSNKLIYLQEMRDAILFIRRHTEAVEAEEFYEDEVLHTAIAHQLQILGQAARKLPDDFAAEYPQVPWGPIIGLRNRIVHEYARLDMRTLWSIVQNDLPTLQAQIVQMLTQIANSEADESENP